MTDPIENKEKASIGSRIKSLSLDVGMYGASTVVGQLIGIALVPIYTRLFTTHEYGVIALLAIITMAIPPVASLGMPSVVMRFLPFCKTDDEQSDLVGSAFAIACTGALLLTGLCFALLTPLTVILVDDAVHRGLLSFVLVTSLMTAIADVPYAVLRSKRRTRLVATIAVIGALAGASSSIFFVVYMGWGLWGHFLGGVIVQSALFVTKLFLVWRLVRFRVDRAVMRKALRYGLPVVPHRILGLVMLVWARYAIKAYLSLAEAGLYAVAAKVAKPLERLVGMFQKAWTPFKMEESANHDDAKTVFRAVFFGYATILGFLWLGASLFGEPALMILTPEPYWPGARLIPAIALVPVCLAGCWMMATGLELGFDMSRLPLVTLTAACVAVGSSILLIKWLGAMGAPLSVACGHLTYGTIIFFLSQRVYPIRYDWGKIVLLAAAAAGLVWATGRSGLPALSFAGLGVRLAGLLAYALVALAMVQRTEAGPGLIRGVRRRFGFGPSSGEQEPAAGK